MEKQNTVVQERKEAGRSRWEKTVKFFRVLFKRKLVLVSTIGLILIVIMAVFAPILAPYDPNEQSLMDALKTPSSQYLLGTDNYGRDILSRIIYGARVSLIVGVLAVGIACAVGTFFGMLAGFFGGIVDDVINRISEAIRAIPQIVLAMALCAVFGGGIINLSIILGISNVAVYIRMMEKTGRLSIKETDYVMAAKLQGNKSLRLMFKHVLPNCISPIIVQMTLQVGQTILSEAGLSFPGAGDQRAYGFLGKYCK